MKIGAEHAVLITGAGSGIGRALALAFAQKGACVSVVDFSEPGGLETLKLVKDEQSKVRASPATIFTKCDVTKMEDIILAFSEHNAAFGRLDVCINSAGIGVHGDFLEDDRGSWRRVIDVNLTAVVECTRQAVKAMRTQKRPGVILNLASASGLYPSTPMPIYSASKAGVVMFTRSMGRLAKEGIRVNALCPEFVETVMTKNLSQNMIDVLGGFISMDKVIDGAFELIEDDSKAAKCLWITNRRGSEYWPSEDEERKFLIGIRKRSPKIAHETYQTTSDLPKDYQKLVVYRLDNNFRSATKIVAIPLRIPVKEGHVLVKNYYAGVNASDVNYSAGRYFGSEKEALSRLPFDAGFEAVGVVAGIGAGVPVDFIKLGSPVATVGYGAFAEYSEVPVKTVIPVPAPVPEVVAILVSGLTASLGLQEAGKMKSGETVLVTAAAGGTGQFAVQLAKLAGNKVIATCGGREKASLLSSLGVDRVIDYKVEDVKTVLKREFPAGVNLIYESVGGKMFNDCLAALAVFGRLVIIGMISQYQGENGWQPQNYPGLCEKLLWKSQTIVGFYLNNHTHQWKDHVAKLHGLYTAGKLKIAIDPTPFNGVESAADAVEHLHSGRSTGKVVIRISNEAPAIKQSRL